MATYVEPEVSSSSSYSDIYGEGVFEGTTPFESILEGIEDQFADYVNLIDRTNYVDIFYKQYYASLDILNNDDSIEYPQDLKDKLDQMYNQFIGTLQQLFESRLTITIPVIEEGHLYRNEVEPILRKLYEFFILSARTNFKIVIGKDLLEFIECSDVEYDLEVKMDDYSPFFKSITPLRFLDIRKDTEISEMFNENQFVGNFLRKYSPKLYQNEDLKSEILNYVNTVISFKKEVISEEEDHDGKRVQ